jgi:hypothetical protein
MFQVRNSQACRVKVRGVFGRRNQPSAAPGNPVKKNLHRPKRVQE